ncbi:hypothetical protein WJX72_003981 [[Myrmecia] bisecta]|uniref:HECT-type E3 ubiquitin transferase n=1 Tax=[Myrmecia] bisecta TaxID=41462 RepID=A0AAW1Q3C4_9CHLO
MQGAWEVSGVDAAYDISSKEATMVDRAMDDNDQYNVFVKSPVTQKTVTLVSKPSDLVLDLLQSFSVRCGLPEASLSRLCCLYKGRELSTNVTLAEAGVGPDSHLECRFRLAASTSAEEAVAQIKSAMLMCLVHAESGNVGLLQQFAAIVHAKLEPFKQCHGLGRFLDMISQVVPLFLEHTSLRACQPLREAVAMWFDKIAGLLVLTRPARLQSGLVAQGLSLMLGYEETLNETMRPAQLQIVVVIKRFMAVEPLLCGACDITMAAHSRWRCQTYLFKMLAEAMQHIVDLIEGPAAGNLAKHPMVPLDAELATGLLKLVRRSNDLLAKNLELQQEWRGAQPVLAAAEQAANALWRAITAATNHANKCLALGLGITQQLQTQDIEAARLLFLPEQLKAVLQGWLPAIHALTFMELGDRRWAARREELLGMVCDVLGSTLLAPALQLKPSADVWAMLQDMRVRNAIPQPLRLKALHMLFKPRARIGPVVVIVSRDNLLEASMAQLTSAMLHAVHLRMGVRIKFEGEEGEGQGVLKEWLCLLAQRVFDPMTGLFTRCPGNQTLHHPTSLAIQEYNNEWMRFAGIVVGLALQNQVPLGVRFTKAFYKAMAGEEVCIDDLQELEPEAYWGYMSLLASEGAADLGLTFVSGQDDMGANREVELTPGGAGIAVTDRNKEEFVELAAKQRLVTSSAEQRTWFVKGLMELCDPSDAMNIGGLLTLVSAKEFNLVVGGLTADLDAADWKAATSLLGWEAGAQAVAWFWQMVGEIQNERRIQLLQFWTGMSAVPMGGFKDLAHQLQLCKLESDDTNRLPVARTCFGQLSFPPYTSYQALRAGFDRALDGRPAGNLVQQTLVLDETGAMVAVAMDTEAESFSIFVKSPCDNKTIRLDVKPTDTVEDLVLDLYSHCRLPIYDTSKSYFVYKGHRLNDDSTLEEAGLGNDSQVECRFRVCQAGQCTNTISQHQALLEKFAAEAANCVQELQIDRRRFENWDDVLRAS